MSQSIFHIYDKVFKKILTLSSKSVINLINGLFGTDYPEDSSIRYNWTEFVGDEFKKILADTIITINEEQSYHLEAQITNDDAIVFRVFDYGFSHASQYPVNSEAYSELCFPEPKIIYLAPDENIPEEYLLRLNFGSQGYFDYRVSTIIFSQISVEELNQRKMIILVPFMLLRLRKTLSKSRSKDNLEALKNLIQYDILGSIEENLQFNNITKADARKLKRYTHKLYEQIYSHYEEMEELNEMTDESLMLDIDIIEKEHEQRLEEMERVIEEKRNVIKAQEDILKEQGDALREQVNALKEQKNALKEKEDALKEKEDEISALKEHIRQLEKQASGNN